MSNERKKQVEQVTEAVEILRNEHPTLIRCPVCHEVIDRVNGMLPAYHVRTGSVELCYLEGP